MGVVAAIAAHFIAIGNFSLGWITLLFVGSATRSVPPAQAHRYHLPRHRDLHVSRLW